MKTRQENEGTGLGQPLALLFLFFLFLIFRFLGTPHALVPQPVIKPKPPAVEAQNPNHWTARESPHPTPPPAPGTPAASPSCPSLAHRLPRHCRNSI